MCQTALLGPCNHQQNSLFWLQGPQLPPLSTILYSLTALQIFSSKSPSIMALGVYRTHKIHKMDRAQVFKHEIDKSILLLVTTTQITSVTSLQLGLDCTHAASKPCAHVQRAARQRTTSFQPSSPLRLSNALPNTPTPSRLADAFPTRRTFNLSSPSRQVDSRHPHSFPT